MVVKQVKNTLTLSQLRTFIGNSALTRRFAEKHGLVYFGSINQDDESRLVRGVTVSNSHRDLHYLVGTEYGHDMIFVQRRDTIHSANKKRKESYLWNILAIDLSDSLHMPHIYIDGRTRHGHGYYETLAMKHREFSELPYGFLSNYDPLFGKHFSVKLSAAHIHEFPSIISPERAAVMAHHFPMLDFELFDDVLQVYLLSSRPSMSQLDTMVKAGVWLANELNKRVYEQTATEQNNTPVNGVLL